MKRNIFIMNLLASLYWMAMYTYVPTLPAYSITLGADAAVLGAIGGAYGIAQILLRIPIGVVSDKTGKNKLLLMAGSGVLAVSAILLLLSDSTGQVLWGRLIAGAAAAWWVVMSATYADYHTESQQMKAQGVLCATTNFGKMIAAAAGGALAQFFGYKAPFVFALTLALFCIVLSAMICDLPKKKNIPALRDMFSLFKNRDLLLFSFLGILALIICFAAPSMFTAVAAQDLGASSFSVGLLNVVYYGTTAVGSLVVGTRLYKKLGGIHAVALGFFLGALSCIPVFYELNLPVIYLMQALSGISSGITMSALAGFVFHCVRTEQRGVATGIFQSLYGIGIFIGPVIVGDIEKAVSFDAAYWTLGAIMVASALLCYWLIPRRYAEA